jgi:murein L,D-transpeptidase YcbB/YkuD
MTLRIGGWGLIAVMMSLLSCVQGTSASALSWTDSSGRPGRDAREALSLLKGADQEGLDPADYHAAAVEALLSALETCPEPSAADIAVFDETLTGNLLRYFHDLHFGRVEPRTVGFRVSHPPGALDFTAILAAALSAHRVAAAAAELTPQLRLYRDLRRELARYRSIAADRSLRPLPSVPGAVHPGDRYAGVPELRRLLLAFGDVPSDAPMPVERNVYAGAVVDGVRHFQVRHGLRPDGVLGTLTREAINVPLTRRVRQIELALERLRWLPDLTNDRLVAVNIPMFRVWAWDSVRFDAVPAMTTGVIVGRALSTRTPVLDEEMRYIMFRPYWNIPTSILRHEILPALSRDPAYLERQDMEIVSGQGDDARPMALTERSLAGLRAGTLRLRQRPGPRNSLGLVKFVFPNDADVYLHATPAQQLFSQSRRDFSHGCVRVEDPVALAEWALKDRPEWTRDRIVAAMHGRESLRVDLQRPIRVILFYLTAVVMPADGTIRFAEDIYRHDAALDRALARAGRVQ